MYQIFKVFCVFFLLNNLAFANAKSNTAPINVLATFSILADIANAIGGDRVTVTSLVSVDQDAHVFRASPSDVRKLSRADLLIYNGLGFEGWLERLLLSANYQGVLVTATKGIDVLMFSDEYEAGHHDHGGEPDPHAWHSPYAAELYVKNILLGLERVDPDSASYYQQNAKTYLAELLEIRQRFLHSLRQIAPEKRNIVVPHNAFAYLARDFGLSIHSLQGLSTESEATASRIASLVKDIRRLDIKAVFSENVADKRLINVIEKETGVSIGGELVSGALSSQHASNYLDMLRYNLNTIAKALSP